MNVSSKKNVRDRLNDYNNLCPDVVDYACNELRVIYALNSRSFLTEMGEKGDRVVMDLVNQVESELESYQYVN